MMWTEVVLKFPGFGREGPRQLASARSLNGRTTLVVTCWADTGKLFADDKKKTDL